MQSGVWNLVCGEDGLFAKSSSCL